MFTDVAAAVAGNRWRSVNMSRMEHASKEIANATKCRNLAADSFGALLFDLLGESCSARAG